MGQYDGQNVEQLREELERRNLDTSGSKADLIGRLQENDSQSPDAADQTTDTSGAENATGGEHGTQEDADRSGQHPAPGDPKVHSGETPGDPRPA